MAPFLPDPIADFDHLGIFLIRARTRSRLTQKELGQLCGFAQSDISKIESGERYPTLPQLARLARHLGISLQWFLTGTESPETALADLAVELSHLGIVDLLVPDARIPGAFRPAEQVVASVLAGDAPDLRVVEALPAVLAWNAWNDRLLSAYARGRDRRVAPRLAWLADIALTIHHGRGFPGGLADPLSLSRFARRTKPRPRPDDLGRPASSEGELPPVSRRWNIGYAADLEPFYRRAVRLLESRAAEGIPGTENPH